MFKSKVARATILAAAAVVLTTVALAPATTLAGKGGGGGGGKPSGGGASISLNQTDPHLGDWVTFTSSGGSGINVVCYQGGGLNMVYAAYQPTGTAFLLGGTSSDWKTDGGPVDCRAYLYGNRGVLATVYFDAGGAR